MIDCPQGETANSDALGAVPALHKRFRNVASINALQCNASFEQKLPVASFLAGSGARMKSLVRADTRRADDVNVRTAETLSRCTGLQTLLLPEPYGVTVPPGVLASLQQLRGLRTLCIPASFQLDAASAATFGNLTTLTMVDFCCRAMPRALLTRLTGLRCLRLDDEKIEGATVL